MNKQTIHTAALWNAISYENETERGILIVSITGETVAIVPASESSNRDGDLIAAAPTLLAALQSMTIASMSDEERIEKARAAIAAANWDTTATPAKPRKARKPKAASEAMPEEAMPATESMPTMESIPTPTSNEA